MHKITQIKQCAACEQSDPQFIIGKNNHHFCQTCFKDFVDSIRVSKKPTTSIKCPLQSCRCQVDFKDFLKYLQLPNACRKCNKEQSYTCAQCTVKEIEEIAKVNYYSKLLKFDQLIKIETQKELYDEITKLELICPVCREFNQIPVIVCLMGHEICKNCYYILRNIEDVRQVCPICKQDLLAPPPNSLRAQKMISNLTIICPNQQCNKPYKYPEFMQNHYRKCCEQKIECQLCHQEVEQLFLDIHQSNYCLESQCPFNCSRKIEQHQNNFIIDHILSAMRQSDVAHSFLVRMQVVEKFLFHGSFEICPNCEFAFLWQVDVRGIQVSFCFQCFRFTG